MSQQYFTERPAARRRPGSVHVVLPDLHLELETDSGVFSPSRLDPGTRLLLETAPPPPAAGNLLDLGCGYGPLALVLAARAPGAQVWAVDVNRRALELCARNAARAGLPNVRCVPPDDPRLPGAFGLIWSNPPIRIGKTALHGLLTAWLARLAAGRGRLSGGAAQPGFRLAAALAGGVRLAGRAGRRAGRVPGAEGRRGGPAGVGRRALGG